MMEMVSFLAGEKWSDWPVCSSPVVARFCQVINDRMDQEFRDKLQAYVPRLIGTASPEHDVARAEYLAWSAVRVFDPTELRAVGLNDWADLLESFQGTLSDAGEVCRSATDAAVYAVATSDAATGYFAAASDYLASSEVFKVLDGLLDIGPSGSDYSQEHLSRVKHLRQAVMA